MIEKISLFIIFKILEVVFIIYAPIGLGKIVAKKLDIPKEEIGMDKPYLPYWVIGFLCLLVGTLIGSLVYVFFGINWELVNYILRTP